MSDLERQIEDLEESIYKTEEALESTKANMPYSGASSASIGGSGGSGKETACYPYVYIVGVLIPILAFAALWFSKPKWVTKKAKGKYVICWQKFLMWVAIIAAIGWVGLYLVNYCGGFEKLKACF